MSDTDDQDLDQQLQEAARADAASVERVVAAALGAPPAKRLPAGRVVAAAALVALIVAAVVLTRPAAPDSPGAIRMRNAGEVILVDYPDGSRALIGPARPDREIFAGFDYLMVQGER